MPPASQKSLVKCPFPTEDALARYVSSPCEDGVNAYAFSTHLVDLTVIVTEISACVSTADLLDDDNSNRLAAFEHHALNLSALQNLEPHVELHIASALHHATIIVDTVFTVCSRSDVFYGWSEVIQPLWNATLTIVSYVSANSLSSEVPRALDSLTRAQDVFKFFSHTCPTALSAKGIVKSLVDSLQNMKAQSACAVANGDPMGWELFASSLEDQQLSPAGLETTLSSNDLYGNVSFSPFMSAA
ncbi:hypothetical protein N7449_011253 [Penicillium cf. viridicatum]|uniref:Uncharacterized protein n=1 Tax=Penicillium cf. viridicatum TaxID=2972119 RepID=A0A9W9M2Q2_9EURO|nr:hypothetical protein N7449_011253 [Penicillium cf. viridicatum]